MRDQALNQLDLHRQQAVRGRHREHHRLEELLLHGGLLGNSRVRSDFCIRVLAVLRKRVDLGDHAPQGVILEAVAHVLPFHLRSRRAQGSHRKQRHIRLKILPALLAGDEHVDANGESERGLAIELADRGPQPVFLILGQARRGEIVALQLAEMALSRIVQHQNQLRAVVGCEALPGAYGFQPMVEVLESLEGIASGNGVDDLPGLFDVGHGMIGLAAPKQLHLVSRSRAPRWRNSQDAILVLASGLEPPTY